MGAFGFECTLDRVIEELKSYNDFSIHRVILLFLEEWSCLPKCDGFHFISLDADVFFSFHFLSVYFWNLVLLAMLEFLL